MSARGLAATIFLLLLFLVPAPPAVAWEQLRGGPLRGSVLEVPERPLDVLVAHDLLPAEEDFSALVGPNLVLTPHGLQGVSRHRETGECVLVTVPDPLEGATLRVPLDGCRYGWLQGYDASHDAILLCSIGAVDHAVLQSRDAQDGTLRWSVAPVDLGVVPDGGATFWSCSGLAIDAEAGEVVGPFASTRAGVDYSRHRIASLDLATGAPRWVQQIAWTGALPGGLGLPSAARGGADGGGADLSPIAATLTLTGLVVTSLNIAPDPLHQEVGSVAAGRVTQIVFAWFTRAGELRGALASQYDPTAPTRDENPVRRSATGSLWAAATGRVAVAAMGDRLALVNPEGNELVNTVPLATVETLESAQLGWTAPAWRGDTVVVPLGSSVAAHNAIDLSKRWIWGSEEGGSFVDDVALTRSGNAYVLTTRKPATSPGGPVELREGFEFGNDSKLTKLDARTGEVLAEIPLRAAAVYATQRDIQAARDANGVPLWVRKPVIVPVGGDRIAVSDLRGRLVVLGEAPPEAALDLRLSSLYPAPGETVTIEVAPPPGVRAVEGFVRWGDVQTESRAVEPGARTLRLEHAYGSPGKVELLATLRFEDGRTSTATATVDVGGSPPPSLNAMQRAFAPGNQDTTWGIIGLALAVLSLMPALFGRARRRRQTAREIALLDAMRERSLREPIAAIRQIEAYRRALEDALVLGRLTEAQHRVLAARVRGIARRIHLHVLAPYRSRLDPALERRLVEAFEDGILDRDEGRYFREGLAREPRLSPTERADLLALLDAWIEEEPPTGLPIVTLR